MDYGHRRQGKLRVAEYQSYGGMGEGWVLMRHDQQVANTSPVYPATGASPLHTMLTDTYTIKTFFDEFTSEPERALRWNGLRHDSGDPIVFAQAVKDAWNAVAKSAGRDVKEVLKGKKVIFSDGLDVPESLRIWNECEKIGIDGKPFLFLQ